MQIAATQRTHLKGRIVKERDTDRRVPMDARITSVAADQNVDHFTYLSHSDAYKEFKRLFASEDPDLIVSITPLFLGEIVRTYTWIIVLGNNGFANSLLLKIGLIDTPLPLMFTKLGVLIALVHITIPVVVLMLATGIAHIDRDYEKAAQSLGAGPIQTFMTVTLPLSMPGIIAGSMLVFIPAVGEYVIPALLGGPDNLMIGRVLWDEFFSNNDWPMASTVAVVMILLIIVPLAIFNKYQAEAQERRA